MAERMQATVAVFLFMLDDQNQVYLQRRYQTGYLDGYYETPSGKVDEGEFPAEAVCREAAEEAGVHVDPYNLELFHSYMNLTDGKPWLGLMFRTRAWEGTPAIQEREKCDAAGFYSLDRLPSPLTPQVQDAVGKVTTMASIEMANYSSIEHEHVAFD